VQTGASIIYNSAKATSKLRVEFVLPKRVTKSNQIYVKKIVFTHQRATESLVLPQLLLTTSAAAAGCFGCCSKSSSRNPLRAALAHGSTTTADRSKRRRETDRLDLRFRHTLKNTNRLLYKLWHFLKEK